MNAANKLQSLNVDVKWQKYDFGSKILEDDVLEFYENQNYKFQAQIFKKINIFGEKLFGDFDIELVVFDKNGKEIETYRLYGLNGSSKGAISVLSRFKESALQKYPV